MAGLFFGFGALFLVAPLENTVVARRSGDFATAIGRRITDRFPGNRATDLGNMASSLSAVASAAPTADNRSHTPFGVTRNSPMRRSNDSSSVAFSGAAPAALEIHPTEVQPVKSKLVQEAEVNQPEIKPVETAAVPAVTTAPEQTRRPLPATVPRMR
jgi:hypothetical protein